MRSLVSWFVSMLAHLDEVLIEASPRFRVRVSVPGARRHFPRSGSSAEVSRVCPGFVPGRWLCECSLSTLTDFNLHRNFSKSDVLLLKSTYKHQTLRFPQLYVGNVMTSPRLGPGNTARFWCFFSTSQDSVLFKQSLIFSLQQTED